MGQITSLPTIHRVVTGHDKDGKAIVISDGPLATVTELTAIPGTIFHEVWNTAGTPVMINNSADPTTGPIILPPPSSGTRIRFVDIPPDSEEFLKTGASKMHDAFSQIGNAHASTVNKDSPHPLMHRTQTIDYGVVIEGRITLILDDSEVDLKPGSVVIQRGTNHAWANRTGKLCRMLFILVDGQFEAPLAQALSKRA